MRILLVHQHFPGQFKHLAPALAARGHEVRALTRREDMLQTWQGVHVHRYPLARGSTPGIHPWGIDFESKLIRAEGVLKAALHLKQQGWTPDVIVAHPGWGEALTLSQVWPEARLGLYCEFFYQTEGSDVGFDPEFSAKDAEAQVHERARVLLKNAHNWIQMQYADAALSPTHWQAATFPRPFRDRMTVVHDGIDTQALAPKADATLPLPSGRVLTRSDEVITFVNRNLEPYRGYHTFMRALPQLLRERPQAQVLLVGGDGVSYGAQPPTGTWKQRFIDEVRPQISDADWERVHFLGNLPYNHFVSLLQVSTVHVYLTYPFVLSWSLLEAMSVGCAIVASDTAPLREAIEDGKTGVLVDFFDAPALAQQVALLAQDAARRQALGQAARAFAQQRYDLQRVCLPGQVAWVEQLGTLSKANAI